MRLSLLLAAMAMTATTAAAQTAPPPATSAAEAFVRGVKACALNVTGQLPLNPPDDAQTVAGLLLADPAGADEIAAFSDLNLSQRMFAAVASTTGSVAIGSDLTQNLCRTVAYDASDADVAQIQEALNGLSGDWTISGAQAGEPVRVYQGTVAGSPILTIRVRQPGWGSAGIMVSLINTPG